MFSLSRTLARRQTSRIPLRCPRVFAQAYSSKPKVAGPNQDIVEMLEWSKAEEETKDVPSPYKIKAFARAIRTVKQLKAPIQSAEDLEVLKGKGIGTGIAGRITAHLTGQEYNPSTKSVEKKHELSPEEVDTNKHIQLLQELTTIAGLGKVGATKLIAAGCRSLDDLHKPELYSMLTTAQQVGFEYREHLDKPVAREESEAAYDFVREYLNSKWEVYIVGSYRRGSPTSSDIDIMMLHPSYVHIPTPDVSNKGKKSSSRKAKATEPQSPLQVDVLHPLMRQGIIAANLVCGMQKWQGIMRIPERDEDGEWGSLQERLEGVESLTGTFRRADISMVPLKSKGAAMLQLTGDLDFNIDARTRAQKMGMLLNEYGLWRFHSHNGDGNGSASADVGEQTSEDGHWELVASETEEEILTALGMSWIEPEKRNFSFLQDNGGKRRKH